MRNPNRDVATTPTARGIETSVAKYLNLKWSIVATTPTARGIETHQKYRLYFVQK